MYRIGEFSKITGLTPQALRYYDSEKILSPSYRDGENGYRYYSTEDIEIAQRIRLLRDFSFSMMEIKDVFSNGKTQEDFHDFIEEKISLLENLIDQKQSLIQKMKAYLLPSSPEKKEVKQMKYEVKPTQQKPQLVASIRWRGKYCEIGDYFAKVYEAANERACGIPFTCYYNLEYAELADMEVCVPVSAPVWGKGIQTKLTKKIDVIGVTHLGAYENLGMAYRALFDYATDHGLVYLAPIVEFYDKGPGNVLKGNPDRYETRVYLPIQKEKR